MISITIKYGNIDKLLKEQADFIFPEKDLLSHKIQVEWAKQLDKDCVIITNNDFIVYSLRLQKKLGKINLFIFYYKDDEIIEILVDENGKLYIPNDDGSKGRIPKGFCDEYGNIMCKII